MEQTSKKRKRMTAAARKAVSIRMSRYWAERRKNGHKPKHKPTTSAAASSEYPIMLRLHVDGTGQELVRFLAMIEREGWHVSEIAVARKAS